MLWVLKLEDLNVFNKAPAYKTLEHSDFNEVLYLCPHVAVQLIPSHQSRCLYKYHINDNNVLIINGAELLLAKTSAIQRSVISPVTFVSGRGGGWGERTFFILLEKGGKWELIRRTPWQTLGVIMNGRQSHRSNIQQGETEQESRG